MSSAICGGVIKKSLFFSDPMAYMMCYYMPDKEFDKWEKMPDGKEKNKFFDEHAISAI